MAPKKRRKRLKWYAGGGVLFLLLFVLGDPFGTFRPGEDGPRAADGSAGRGDIEGPIEGPVAGHGGPTGRAPDTTGPDADLAAHGGESDVEDPRPGRGPGSGTGKDAKASPPDELPPAEAAPLDEVTSLIARFERALSDEDLASLASLEDSVRQRPIVPPASLATRWREVQKRAEQALQCGPRILGMIQRGEILALEALLAGLRGAGVPGWLRDRVDAASEKHHWPALTRGWEVIDPAAGKGDDALPRARRVRFLMDGELQEGVLWRARATDATVRMSGEGGFTFPVVARSDVEPVDPRPEEALAQGLASARAGNGLRVVLWSCHLKEKGADADSARLRAWVR